ncbi:MAG: tetratricopeptide repeat protein, partial [Pirellulales bacterium]
MTTQRQSPDAGFYRMRGAAYFENGDQDKALADYAEAILLNPDDCFAYSTRGYIYSVKGEYDRAIHEYDQAIRLSDAYINSEDGKEYSSEHGKEYGPLVVSRVYNNRGDAYVKKGEYDRAIADCTASLRLDSDCAVAYET